MGHLGNDTAQATMAQTFLHARQHRLLVSGLDVDHAIRRQARLGDGGSKQIGSREAP